MTSQEDKRAKSTKLYNTVRVVLAAILGLGAAYLVYKYKGRLERFLPETQSNRRVQSLRKATWAQRVKLSGAPNLHKVSGGLYRGAQPSKEEAIAEMTKGGFGYHSVWKNLVEYIGKLDVERVKRKAGLGELVSLL